jgi:hypothetical protein
MVFKESQSEEPLFSQCGLSGWGLCFPTTVTSVPFTDDHDPQETINGHGVTRLDPFCFFRGTRHAGKAVFSGSNGHDLT